MEIRILAILACLTIALCGCAHFTTVPTVAQQTPAVTSKADTAPQAAKLPVSYAPGAGNSSRLTQAAEAFRVVPSLNSADTFTVVHSRDIASKSHFNSAVVSKCDQDVIKAFVAANWVPAIVVDSPVGPKHIRFVIGYDDSSKKMILNDPVDVGESKQIDMDYSEFAKLWSDPQKTCLIISAQRVNEVNIKEVLGKYLPKDKIDTLVIRAQSR